MAAEGAKNFDRKKRYFRGFLLSLLIDKMLENCLPTPHAESFIHSLLEPAHSHGAECGHLPIYSPFNHGPLSC